MANQESLQSLFDLAQKNLAEKKFSEAKDLLLKIKGQGFVSASTEAALGRCFFETGDPGKGIASWTQAVALDRWNSTYRADLALAQSRVEGNSGTRLEHPSEIAHTISSYFRPSEQFFTGSLLLLIFIWLYLAGFLEKLSKLFRFLCVFLIVLVFMLGAFSLSSRSLAVISESTKLKPAPLESAEGTLELRSGTRVRILKKSGNYLEIERPNGFRGWVDSKTLVPSPF